MRTKNPTKKTSSKEITRKKDSVVTPENKEELTTLEIQEAEVVSAEIPVTVAELETTENTADIASAVEKVEESEPAKKSETKKKNVQENKQAGVKEVKKTEVPAKKEPAKKVKQADKSGEEGINKKDSVEKKSKSKNKIVLQYSGHEVDTEALIQRVKEVYISEGHKESDVNSVELYIKPEDFAVYYVVNGICSGMINF